MSQAVVYDPILDDYYTTIVKEPVYNWGTASIPVTKEILYDLPRQQGKTNFNEVFDKAMDSYKEQITKTINQESPFLDLLKKKTKQAEYSIKEEINRAIWGEAPVRNEELRRCIGDAYDKHVNEDTPKEAIMNTAVEKVMAERAEDRAREALVALDEFLDDYEYGSTVSWTVQFDVKGKVYNYAAVYAKDGLWYITNRQGGVKTEVLKAQLAEWAIEAHEVLLDGTTVL